MRLMVIIALLLGVGTGLAFAEVAPANPAAPGALPKSRQTISAEKSAHEAAVANCEQMWDRATHMTRQEWSRTCRRVQNRLQEFRLK